MAIEFECQCGKVLRARDDTAGKRARCPSCNQSVLIPPALALQGAEADDQAPATDGPTAACPNCGEPVAASAVVCVSCGFNTKTGSITDTRLEPAKRTIGLLTGLPVQKIVAAAVVALVLAVGWFVVAAPILGKMALDNARGYVTNGNLKKALAEFGKLRAKTSGAQRDRVDLWIAQLNLELENNTGKTLSSGKLITADAVKMSVGKRPGSPGGAMLFRVKIANNGDQPLTLSNDHFYLRGISDTVFVAGHTDNSLDGVVVPPGEAIEEGILAFRKMPNHPVRRRIGRFEQTNYYIMFNNGQTYVKCMLPF